MKRIDSTTQSSKKITLIFTFFTFISLVVLLIGVNIIYFFAWYSDQKEESMYDMNMNYDMYSSGKNETNLESFKNYILQKDTLIIPKDGGDLICSNGVETKIHNNIEKIKDKLFYNNGEKTFFIFTQHYEEIGEVKVFFDTTPYVKSQILIIKISLIIIFFLLIIYYFVSKIIAIKALKNMKQFITDVSHEFKTPLMVIDSEIDLYSKKVEKNKLGVNDTGNLLLNIKNKTSKLNTLLETFILLSRIDNDIQYLNFNRVNLGNYIKNISRDFINSSEKNVVIDYKIEQGVTLDIEQNTFSILFENILSNAIKFSKEGGKIEIGLDNKSLWIKDNGKGISSSNLKNIWKKFYRNDTKVEGFGVGLYIVKRLVKLYKWKIEVKSEEGKGTIFIIKF